MLDIKVMEPIRTTEIPQGDNWVHEVKFDGMRGLLIYHKGKFELYSKNGKQVIEKFPEIIKFKDIFAGDSVIIDGELTVWKNERHSFHDILVRARSRAKLKIESNIVKYPLTYVMFDILKLNGKDLTGYPLLERKKILKSCTSQTNGFIHSDYFEDGDSLFEEVKKLGYEGIVSKVNDSPYVPQKKHSFWYKIKVKKKILAVIGGLKMKNNTIKSLILGIYQDNQLMYIGNAYIGLSQNDLQLLKNNLSALEANINPFANISASNDMVFVEPLLTCWIEYLEWTNSGKLRHPQIIGFSDLKAESANGVEFTI